MMKIERLLWDEETSDHIAKHSISPEEVEQSLFNEEDVPIIMRGREGKHLAYGRTNRGRFLFVVLAIRHRRTSVITARDMTKAEKQYYKRMTK
jgi:uncharacterized protein